MNHRIRRSDEEWMQLITSCRPSGLSGKEWCTAGGWEINLLRDNKGMAVVLVGIRGAQLLLLMVRWKHERERVHSCLNLL